MPWMIDVNQVEEICNEIEKALNACGHSTAISIVRTKFCHPRDVVWLDDVSEQPKCELRLLDWSGLDDVVARLRIAGGR